VRDGVRIVDGVSAPVEEQLRRLARHDTCAVSDALERTGRSGVLTGLSRVTTESRVAGIAVTMQLGPAGAEKPAHHLGARAVEASDARSVIVVAGGSLECGGWGGLLSRAALFAGVRGTVVDGLARDVDEAAELGFPVFARGVTPVTARGRQVEVSCGEPVVVGGVPVSPGDLVLADGSGVVVVPAEAVDEVLDAADEIADREAAMVGRLRAGEPPSAVMDRSYETMLEVDGERTTG
jgi:regulator of RNase E activity RraA